MESKKGAEHSTCHGRTELLVVVVAGVATAVAYHAMSKASSPSMATGDHGKSKKIDDNSFFYTTIGDVINFFFVL